jgi:hypothetical protein
VVVGTRGRDLRVDEGRAGRAVRRGVEPRVPADGRAVARQRAARRGSQVGCLGPPIAIPAAARPVGEMERRE